MVARQYVQSSSYTPLPFGLLSTLGPEIRSPADPHWQLGVTWEPLCGNGGTTYEECFVVSGSGLGPVESPAGKAATGALDRRGATPFTVTAEVDCSTPGFWTRAQQVVGDLLTQSEQWQVERAFWTGLAAGVPVVYPHLAANTELEDAHNIILQTAATEIVTGGGAGALDVVEALGRLEGAIANCYDGVPVIHAPRVLAAAFVSEGLITREGPRYRTASGSIVVFGAGYPGTSPDGVETAGVTWMYATGSMFVYRGRPVILPIRDSQDRTDNTVRAIAERTYVLGWDCCHYAVPVSIGGVVTGAAGSAT